MKYLRLLLLMTFTAMSFAFLACSESTTDTNTNLGDSVSYSSLNVVGKLQTFILSQKKFVAWSKGAGKIEARINGSKTNVVGTGTIIADGTFSLTYFKNISKKDLSPFSQYAVYWGSGVKYTPSDGQFIPIVKHYAIITANNIETEYEFSCRVNSSQNETVQAWDPVIFSGAGSIKGTDKSGYIWDCTFKQGWNFMGSYYNTPSTGLQKFVCDQFLPANVVWYDTN